MSANQSFLSSPQYQYDLVVATTQDSINATMKEYLALPDFPVVKMYWTQDDSGNTVPISYADLMVQTHGTDPLNVGDWKTGDPVTPEIENIINSQFAFAFEAAIGIPAGATAIPDIVTLQVESQTVLFNLICSSFKVTELKFLRGNRQSLVSHSQSADQPWIFSSTIKLSNILDNSNLPPVVYSSLNNLGPDAFSVQQLLFDLDNAALQSAPVLSGVTDADVVSAINAVFVTTYMGSLKAQGSPVLNYTITPNAAVSQSATDVITDMSFEVSPYQAAPGAPAAGGLNTLNYLCAVNNDTLPLPVPFGWNWVESTDTNDGVIAVNKNHFITYFQEKITTYAQQNCFLPYVSVYTNGGVTGTTHFDFSLTPGQTPSSVLLTGSEIISLSYTASVYDDSHQGAFHQYMGGMTLAPSFSISVQFTGKTIVIVQNLTIYTAVHAVFNAHTDAWNPVNRTITDTYTLTVGPDNKLKAVLSSSNEAINDDPTPQDNWFVNLFTNLNDLAKDIATWTQNFASVVLHDIPVGVAESYVFPGGNTFTYQDVLFSDNLDLVTKITYTTPTQP